MRIHFRDLLKITGLVVLGLLFCSCGDLPGGGIVDNGVKDDKTKTEEQEHSAPDASDPAESQGSAYAEVEIKLDKLFKANVPSGYVKDTSETGKVTFKRNDQFLTFAKAAEVAQDCGVQQSVLNSFNVEIYKCSATIIFLKTPEGDIVSLNHNISVDAEAAAASFRAAN